MKIAILGAGNVGAAIAGRLASAGHHVSLAASSPNSPRLLRAAADSGAEATSALHAAGVAELVILAVPFAAVDDVLTADVCAALAGKIVVDATNPLSGDFLSLTIGHTTSAGEQIAARLPQSEVVKAFNTIMAPTLTSPVLGGSRQLLPIAGDNPAAKAVVLQLGIDLGFDAVDSGSLTNARYLEPTVELLIQLAYGQGLGANIGLHLTRA